MAKQTVNRRSDGRFAPGNTVGRRFQSGESGNPNGRPPERPLTRALRDVLEANDCEAVKAIVQTAVERAKAGDFRYFKEILDRVDGRAREEPSVESEPNPPQISSDPRPDLDAKMLEATLKRFHPEIPSIAEMTLIKLRDDPAALRSALDTIIERLASPEWRFGRRAAAHGPTSPPASPHATNERV